MLKYIFVILLSFVIFPGKNRGFSKGKLAQLDEESWTELLTGEWMVEFYAPWCPACQQLEPLWREFADWSDDLSIKVGSVDITINPGLSGRFMIAALPTIFHVKDGVFRQYLGSRDRESFISFVEEKKWTSIDPVPSWKSPQSYGMSTVSGFYRLAMKLRIMHNTLVDGYGIPYWGSYIIFGLLTMLVGVLLGLLIVYAIDIFCPSRMGYQPLPNTSNAPNEKELGARDIGEDVIRNDNEDESVRRRL